MKKFVVFILFCCLSFLACAEKKGPVDYDGQRDRAKEGHRSLDKE